MKFPEGFYWGAATASYQVEGGIENCDWAQAAREGRVPECGRACDHYNRYEQDFDLAKELGHNAHRFSIEWARIEPEEGQFNERQINHYRAVIKALKDRGLQPYVTLWHFTLPQWFADMGGFENKKAPEYFARYASVVAKELGGELEGISTMNEPIVFSSNGWLRGTWPPFKRFKLIDLVAITNSGKSYEPNPQRGVQPLFLMRKVRRNLAEAHNRAYDAIKKEQPMMEVSIVKHVILFEANWNPINKLIAWLANWQWTYNFMNKVHQKCDSIGLNYYFHKKFGDREVYDKTDMDWDIYPQGVYDCLKILWKYKKPLFVSESGIADAADRYRAQYIKDQVAGVAQALEEGIDVRGHLYWSLMDNYEWALGFDKKFGLIEIDYHTLERKIRPSAWVYKELIETYSR